MAQRCYAVNKDNADFLQNLKTSTFLDRDFQGLVFPSEVPPHNS